MRPGNQKSVIELSGFGIATAQGECSGKLQTGNRALPRDRVNPGMVDDFAELGFRLG